jgi:CRISPR-associated exonuclease Cas4
MSLEFWIALGLAGLALVLFWQAARQRASSGLPGGRVIYADPRLWGPVEKPLYDSVTGLTGRPDYLVAEESSGQIIPVEVKTGRTPPEPRDAHIFQLAVYCYLVEQTMGVRPRYGILHYPERTYAIDFTRELESTLLDLLEEMRACDRKAEMARSHEIQGRCAGCGYRSQCDQRL